MNILITGITGFIGKNLFKFLQADSSEVSIFGMSRDVNKCKLHYGKNLKCLATVDESILDKLSIKTVIHLAGIAHDLKGRYSPNDYERVNFGLTQHLYSSFLKAKCPTTFIFVSSVKALADDVQHVLDENSLPDPKTPYGISKLRAEEFVRTNTKNNKKFYILRPAMVYGPDNKGNLNMLYQFIKKGFPYPFGAFQNKRSFLSVNNLSFIISELLQKNIPSGDYNCADSKDLSSIELVQLISTALNKKSKVLSVHRGIIKSAAALGGILHLPFNKQVLSKLTSSYRVSSVKLLRAFDLKELPYRTDQEMLKTIKSFDKG